MAEIVEAKIWQLRGVESWPPVAFQMQIFPLRRAEYKTAEDLTISPDRMQRLNGGTVENHPASVAGLVPSDADGAGLNAETSTSKPP